MAVTAQVRVKLGYSSVSHEQAAALVAHLVAHPRDPVGGVTVLLLRTKRMIVTTAAPNLLSPPLAWSMTVEAEVANTPLLAFNPVAASIMRAANQCEAREIATSVRQLSTRVVS